MGSKTSALTAMTTWDPTTDLVRVIDISDTTMAASGTDKKATLSAFTTAVLAAPPAIGGTTPAAGSFTTVTSTVRVLVAQGSAGAPALGFSVGGGLYEAGGVVTAVGGDPLTRVSSSALGIKNTLPIAWTDGNATGAADTKLFRDAANTLALRNGTAAQTFRVYNTWTDASNGEWGAFNWSTVANRLTIGPVANGSGTLRSIGFTSHVLWNTDNTYDIGASGATRPRNGFFSSGVIAENAIRTGDGGYLGWGVRSVIRSPADGFVTLLDQAETSFGRLQLGGTTVASPAVFKSGSVAGFRQADGTIATFANLPAAAAGNEGAVTSISDGSTATWGATVTGGGANRVMVRSNGSAWTVIGM